MPTDKETMIEYERELQGLLSAPRCAVSGCPNLDIDQRGPVWMRREDIDMAFEVCTAHWEATIRVLGQSDALDSESDSELVAVLRDAVVGDEPPDLPQVMDPHAQENYERGIKLIEELEN